MPEDLFDQGGQCFFLPLGTWKIFKLDSNPSLVRNMKDYVSGIISILASFQLLFVSVFLIAHKKGNKTNNRLLGLIFMLFSISLGDFALRISNP